MILLDTNVVSEAMRTAPEPRVIEWLDSQAAETLHLSAVSLAELLYGIASLPRGRRRAELQRILTETVALLFGERVLPFDIAAAHAYADIMGATRGRGRTLGVADGQIAAIAVIHRFAIATRDTTPFESAGIPIINPWTVAK